MALRSVQLEAFRCFSSAHLELDPGSTLICGLNGSGKTTLLEAIFVLGRGRSFRTLRLDTAVRHGSARFQVIGRVELGPASIPIGVEHAGGQTVARARGEAVATLAELSALLPVQVIDPGIHKLIEEGPARRRRFLDWGVFHVEHGYLEQWQRFHRALRQRNAALRQGGDEHALEPWEDAIADAGEEVGQARLRYFMAARPFILAAAQQLTGAVVELEYTRGWPSTDSLGQALIAARGKDRLRRSTSVGPHRADLRVLTPNGPARELVSRGQQKLLAAGLILGQLEFHVSQHGRRPTLLLDDPAAELDQSRIDQFLSLVFNLQAQLVVTSLPIHRDLFRRMGHEFHVEQGEVGRVL